MKKQLIEAGKIVSTQGLKGEMRIMPWCDSPDFLMNFKTVYLDENTPLDVEKARTAKNVTVLKLKGIDDIDAANAYRGKIIYINKLDVSLPENTYFIQDLIGLSVVDADDSTVEYGVLSDVSYTGANDVYHVKKDDREYLIPAIKQVVIKTDIENGQLVIRPIKGLFDDED